jgi:hypothetical protein
MEDLIYTDDICSLVPVRIWSMYFCVWLCGFERVLDQFPYCRWSHTVGRGGILGWEYHTTDNQYHSPVLLFSFAPTPHPRLVVGREVSQLSVQPVILLVGMPHRSSFTASLPVMPDHMNRRILPSLRLVSVLLQVVVNFKGFSHLICGVIRSVCHWLLEFCESIMFCCYNSLVCVPTPPKAFCPPNVS